MTVVRTLLLILFALAACGLQAREPGPLQAIDPQRLDAFVSRGMDLWNVPGMAVAVVSPDEVEYLRGFGVTAIDNGRPVNEHTLFANASTTKAMVAAGVLILADDGRLSLDDLVVRHIPELHFHDALLTRELTVRDLLTHRSGLPSTDFWTFFQNMPLEEQIRRLAAVESAAALRTRHIYQNTMYELVGLVIERAGGQRWDRFLAERLWGPIGMRETFGNRAQIPAGFDHVLPHRYEDGQLAIEDWDLPADLANAAGSAWTSVHDMALWAQFLLRGGVTADGQRLISEERFAEYFRPQQLIAPADFYPTAEITQPNWIDYALGWFQQDFQGRMIDYHTGSLSGLIAIIGLDRASGRAVVVLGNRDHAEMRHAVLWEVMDQAPAGERRDWNRDVWNLYEARAGAAEERWQAVAARRLPGTQPSLPLAAYAGRYDNPVLGQLTVDSVDGALRMKAALMELPLSHWHHDVFLLEYEPWQLREFVEFRVGPRGTVDGFTLFGEAFRAVEAGR